MYFDNPNCVCLIWNMICDLNQYDYDRGTATSVRSFSFCNNDDYDDYHQDYNSYNNVWAIIYNMNNKTTSIKANAI